MLSSEFIAMKTRVEHITALRYKLRIFGISFNESANLICSNRSVVINSPKLESILDKKHYRLANHAMRWAVTSVIVFI